MRRLMLFPLVACAALALSGCGAMDATAPPSSAGTTAPLVVVAPANPLERTTVDDEAIRFGFEALSTVASALDAAMALGVIVPKSPKANAIADGLEGTLHWFNAASAFQRAGQAGNAFTAWQQAKAGLANVRAALGTK